MRRVNVAHFETRAIAAQTARTERTQTALVRQLRERIDLVHEVRQLAAAKEIFDHRAHRLRIYQALRRELVFFLEVHALAHGALHAHETDAHLVCKQLAHRAHAAVTQVIDVV